MGLRDRVLLSALASAHFASLTPARLRFEAAARDPAVAQRKILRDLLARNAGSEYLRACGLGATCTLDQYRSAVPISSLTPFIERAAAGGRNVLTSEPVIAFERTSGTSGQDKLIPYTRSFLREISAATGPWLSQMYQRHPRLIGTTSYWSISPAVRAPETTSGGVRIGFSDDTEYFSGLERWALGKMMSRPAASSDFAAWRRETARHLLSDRALGLISVWSPSFLTLIMEEIEDQLGTFPEVKKLWPRLQLISCWTEGHAAQQLPAMQRYFPEVQVEPKGLLATEGVVSFPIAGGAPVLAVASHFLEFTDLAAPLRPPLLASELSPGGRYTPILTTGAGLWRYPLGDEIEVTSFYQKTPRVRFLGKLDRVSDLCGEKVHEADAIAARRRVPSAFFLLAPVLSSPPHYRVFVEPDPKSSWSVDQVAREVEAELLDRRHYRYCRELGQLGPVDAVFVSRGRQRYEEALVQRGATLGTLKPSPLDVRTFWAEVFR